MECEIRKKTIKNVQISLLPHCNEHNDGCIFMCNILLRPYISQCRKVQYKLY